MRRSASCVWKEEIVSGDVWPIEIGFTEEVGYVYVHNNDYKYTVTDALMSTTIESKTKAAFRPGISHASRQ